MSDTLGDYLNNHLAGSDFAIELLGLLREQNPGKPLAAFSLEMLAQVREDRTFLQGIIDRTGEGPSPFQQAAMRAFSRDHGESSPGLEQYEVKDYPGFQFFQALWLNQPRHFSQIPLHSAVDLRTGDVWDSVSCERLTSPSLRKSQNAIRNRIGLTADEYRQTARLGPFCEQ